MSDSLYDTALGLHPGKIRVNRNPAVHYRNIIQNFHFSGILIQLDFHHSDHVRRRGNRGGMGRGRNRCNIVIYLVFDADLCQRNAFLRVDLLYPSVFKHNLFCAAAKHSRRDPTELCL